MDDGIVMITSGFPRLSETFALNELLGLEARGLLAAIFATKPGDGGSPQPGSERLLGRVQTLPPGSPAEQAAAVVARLAGRRVRGVHGYFAHTPAEVAAQVARRLGVPYSFSVHARDARKVAPAVLGARARGAACVIACNPDVARDIPHDGGTIHLAPHGVDLRRFHPRPAAGAGQEPLRMLAVGRLVPKKGFDVLIDAAAQLGFPFRLLIVGEGPERERLAAKIAAAGLAEQVLLGGHMTHAALPAAYADAQIVVVPSVVDSAGDRDGLPNVVLEAMASARPVVASDVGAIRSAVSSWRTGVLVPPGDAGVLAAGLETLARRPELREQLGQCARKRVESTFALERCIERLQQLLERAYA
jgi:glycosyltransferase involved in cell wall biosynthesis